MNPNEVELDEVNYEIWRAVTQQDNDFPLYGIHYQSGIIEQGNTYNNKEYKSLRAFIYRRDSTLLTIDFNIQREEHPTILKSRRDDTIKVSSLRDLEVDDVRLVRKLKHTVDKISSLQDLGMGEDINHSLSFNHINHSTDKMIMYWECFTLTSFSSSGTMEARYHSKNEQWNTVTISKNGIMDARYHSKNDAMGAQYHLNKVAMKFRDHLNQRANSKGAFRSNKKKDRQW
jgi:hypothetical protein